MNNPLSGGIHTISLTHQFPEFLFWFLFASRNASGQAPQKGTKKHPEIRFARRDRRPKTQPAGRAGLPAASRDNSPPSSASLVGVNVFGLVP